MHCGTPAGGCDTADLLGCLPWLGILLMFALPWSLFSVLLWSWGFRMLNDSLKLQGKAKTSQDVCFMLIFAWPELGADSRPSPVSS